MIFPEKEGRSKAIGTVPKIHSLEAPPVPNCKDERYFRLKSSICSQWVRCVFDNPDSHTCSISTAVSHHEEHCNLVGRRPFCLQLLKDHDRNICCQSKKSLDALNHQYLEQSLLPRHGEPRKWRRCQKASLQNTGFAISRATTHKFISVLLFLQHATYSPFFDCQDRVLIQLIRPV